MTPASLSCRGLRRHQRALEGEQIVLLPAQEFEKALDLPEPPPRELQRSAPPTSPQFVDAHAQCCRGALSQVRAKTFWLGFVLLTM
jgi:hypothetical protein